jgi:AcrR family transcriptional regulator
LSKIRDPAARQRIVEVAAGVVAEAGLHGATIRAIASAAGVTTGYITHYFDDKQALISEVMSHTNATAARRVRSAAARAHGGLAGLEAVVDAMLPLNAARMQEWRIWIAVWGQSTTEEEYAEGYRAGWSGLRGIFVELLGQAVAAGELRADIDAEFEAELLVTMLAGVGLLAGVQKPARVRAQAKRMLAGQIDVLRFRPAGRQSAA